MRTVNDIPAPRQLPFVGVLPEFRRDALALYRRINRECGPVAKYRALWFESFIVNDPELIGEILVDEADAFEKNWYEMILRPAMGVGLFLIDTDKHRQRRKLVAPAFQHRRIADYADTMVSLTQEILGTWKPGDQIDLSEEMTTLTLRIVVRALFGTDMAGDTRVVGQAITDLIHDYTSMFKSVVMFPPQVPTPRNRRMQRNIAILNDTVEHIVAQRRTSHEDHGDLLAMLLASQDEESGASLTNEEIRDEVKTIFLAGHETTATALSWALGLLSVHPDIRQRAEDEVDAVLGDRAATFADVNKLQYLTRILKETMRLYPPLYIYGREARREVTIGDITFPKRSTISIVPYILHRRPDIYPDPERFDPDRWTPEMEKRLPRHGYLPFSGGPRICIGNQFAMMEGALVLATILQRWRCDLTDGMPAPDPLLTLRPRGAMMVAVRERVAHA